MHYCRINLFNTNYEIIKECQVITDLEMRPVLHNIYYRYCKYKNFESVMPLFDSQLSDPTIDIIGYFDNNNIVAFSLIKRYDTENAEALQFAWDYEKPNLRLGIKSLKNECAFYKKQGFKFLYLGLADDYKKQIQGFELLGKLE